MCPDAALFPYFWWTLIFLSVFVLVCFFGLGGIWSGSYNAFSSSLFVGLLDWVCKCFFHVFCWFICIIHVMCTYIYLRCHGVCMKNHRLSRQGTRTTVWMCCAQFSLIRLVKYMQCSKCMYVWHYASAQDNKQWQHFNLWDLQWLEWIMTRFVYVCVFLYL